ncbi:hypothetical protein [Bacteroides sp. 51]|uniref:hypothetical protein n=1 Tax=Bacteroides sp. 51 TaxID=2302938 RepID=UPI0013D876F4|nr:hypothetical protein [Bacteroides sp. 51]
MNIEKNNMKGELLHSRFLNDHGIGILMRIKHHEEGRTFNAYQILAQALDIPTLEEMVRKNIFFLPMYSPASISAVQIPESSIVISFDIHFIIKIGCLHTVAVLLHEIGHTMNPNANWMTDEFYADDFVISHHFKDQLLEMLDYGIINFPETYNKPITYDRISRIKNL